MLSSKFSPRHTLTLLIISFTLAQLFAAATTEYDVEHKFSADSEFSKRGTLKCFPSTRLQCTVDNNLDLADSFNSLTGEGYYYMRVCTKDKHCVQTFIKQCLLVESDYNELIEVNAAANHALVSVSLLTPISMCNSTASHPLSASVNTRVEVIEPLSPPEPETSLYIKRVEEEKRRKLKGDGEENKSFFAKYWMYIVPVLILVMLSSQNEQGGE